METKGNYRERDERWEIIKKNERKERDYGR